jgi:hypothetical protein
VTVFRILTYCDIDVRDVRKLAVNACYLWDIARVEIYWGKYYVSYFESSLRKEHCSMRILAGC